jgi:DNA-directed RNA polymerase subunit RPC12/RpoP
MSDALEDAPLCSECGRPMEETSAQNAQLFHGGVPFACQSNQECSEYAPDGVGTVGAVDLLDVIGGHNPTQGDTITLRCEKCGTNTVFGPEGLNANGRIVCPTCNLDSGSVAELLAIKESAAKTLQSALGKTFEGIEGIKFIKNDI